MKAGFMEENKGESCSIFSGAQSQTVVEMKNRLSYFSLKSEHWAAPNISTAMLGWHHE